MASSSIDHMQRFRSFLARFGRTGVPVPPFPVFGGAGVSAKGALPGPQRLRASALHPSPGGTGTVRSLVRWRVGASGEVDWRRRSTDPMGGKPRSFLGRRIRGVGGSHPGPRSATAVGRVRHAVVRTVVPMAPLVVVAAGMPWRRMGYFPQEHPEGFSICEAGGRK